MEGEEFVVGFVSTRSPRGVSNSIRIIAAATAAMVKKNKIEMR